MNTKENIAILTGKINKLTVVECDFYDKGDYTFDTHTNSFCQQFGFPSEKNNYLFDTFTCKSASGGYHFYFQYDRDIRQTQNETEKIDIRSDGGYIMQYNYVYNNNRYKLLHDKPVKQIPEKQIPEDL